MILLILLVIVKIKHTCYQHKIIILFTYLLIIFVVTVEMK